MVFHKLKFQLYFTISENCCWFEINKIRIIFTPMRVMAGLTGGHLNMLAMVPAIGPQKVLPSVAAVTKLIIQFVFS